MNVNIFLRQFKAKNEDIVTNIANGDVEKFGGAERLKGLLKLMPEKQEVSEGSINVCTLSRGGRKSPSHFGNTHLPSRCILHSMHYRIFKFTSGVQGYTPMVFG